MAPGSRLTLLPGVGHTKFLDGGRALDWLLDRCLNGGNVPRAHVMQLTVPCMLAWLCRELHLGEGATGNF